MKTWIEWCNCFTGENGREIKNRIKIQREGRPWKRVSRGGWRHHPPLEILLQGRLKAWAAPEIQFPPSQNLEFHSNFYFPPIYCNTFPSVFNYFIFYFPPIFTCKAIAAFDSGFQNSISVLFKFVFPANSISIPEFFDRWWIYFVNITNYKFNIKSYKSIITCIIRLHPS